MEALNRAQGIVDAARDVAADRLAELNRLYSNLAGCPHWINDASFKDQLAGAVRNTNKAHEYYAQTLQDWQDAYLAYQDALPTI